MSRESSGRQLLITRIVWIGFALFLAALHLAGQIAAFRAGQQLILNPTQEQALRDLGLSAGFYTFWQSSWQWPLPIVWGGLGVLIFWRKPRDRAALVISLMMVGIGLGTAIPVWEAFATAYPNWSWLVPIAAFAGNMCLVSFFFTFPTGRFVPTWTPLLVIVYSVSNILISYDFVLPPQLLKLVATLEWFPPLVLFISSMGFVVAPIYRYRVSTTIERQQIKWVIFVTIVGFFLFLAAASTVILIPGNDPLEGDITFITLFVQPLGWIGVFQSIGLAIAISILRHRLFDIDFIIRKTLVYAVLTTSLGLVYFGTVVSFQSAFGRASGEQSPLIIVFSTLLIAALFSPLRRRIQAFIDRRFFRRKYDASQTLTRFSQTARDEVDLGRLTAELVQMIEATMQPDRVTLWLKSEPPAGRRRG